METLNARTLQEMSDRIFRQRHLDRREDAIDFVCGSAQAADIEWMWREYMLDKEWNDRHRAIWWAKLTPAQRAREERRQAVYFKLEAQWARKTLPLPGTPDFSIRYADQNRDEYGDLMP